MAEHTIEVHNLTKRYGAKAAISDLSFAVRPGRVTGFLGPNGAGKSTTMRVILGLDRPTRGSATIGGRPLGSAPAPLCLVGAMLDAAAVHGGRSAYHHLLALAQSNNIPRRRVAEVIGLVGLAEVAGTRVKGFSLGMRQRLGIAAALLGDPPVLMFDEPVNGLDPEGIRWIRTLTRSLAAEGRTVLVSSHLMSEMEHTADHLVLIGRGRLMADTSMARFIESSGPGYVRIRSPHTATLVPLLRSAGARLVDRTGGELEIYDLDCTTISDLASDAGVRLTEISPQHVSLEQAFMRLTEDAVEYRGDTRPAATR